MRDSDTRDTCPINFVDIPLGELPREHFLDVERLNMMLVLTNELSDLKELERASIPDWLRNTRSFWQSGTAQSGRVETP